MKYFFIISSLFFSMLAFSQDNAQIIYSINLKENDSIERSKAYWEESLQDVADQLHLSLVFNQEEAHLKFLENTNYNQFIENFEHNQMVLLVVFGFYNYYGEIWQKKDYNHQFRPKLMYVDDCLVEIEPDRKWEVLDEEKEILGYSCKKAILKSKFFNSHTIKHHNYEIVAWFTEDLAHPFGPFISTNLPGLILGYEDLFFSFEAIEYQENTNAKIPKLPPEYPIYSLKNYKEKWEKEMKNQN